MEWEEDFGIKVEFGKNYILKRMPSIEHRDIIVSMVLRDGTDSKTMERKNGNWKKQRKTEQGDNLEFDSWCIRHEWNKWHRIGKARYESVIKLEKESRQTVKKREKLGMWHLAKKNTSEITGHELGKCDDRRTGKTTRKWLEEIT